MRYSASLAEEVAGVLAATVPLGMPSGKIGHHPGWKPLQGSATIMSQARLHARAGSPEGGQSVRDAAGRFCLPSRRSWTGQDEKRRSKMR